MTSPDPCPTLVIGLGNRFRGDDAVGLETVDALRSFIPPKCRAVEHLSDGADLMQLWREEDRVIIVDAVRSGAESGKIHRLDACQEPLPLGFFSYSTHAFSLAEAVEMARTLGQLPAALKVFGIEGDSFEIGQQMSERVRLACQSLIDELKSVFAQA